MICLERLHDPHSQQLYSSATIAKCAVDPLSRQRPWPSLPICELVCPACARLFAILLAVQPEHFSPSISAASMRLRVYILGFECDSHDTCDLVMVQRMLWHVSRDSIK